MHRQGITILEEVLTGRMALAYWIDHLIRTGEVADLAAVARRCGVSRARLTMVLRLMRMATSDQQRTLDQYGRTNLTPPAPPIPRRNPPLANSTRA